MSNRYSRERATSVLHTDTIHINCTEKKRKQLLLVPQEILTQDSRMLLQDQKTIY